jgi:hypothetical protein
VLQRLKWPLRRCAFARFWEGGRGGVGGSPPPEGTGWLTYSDGDGGTGYVLSDEGERLTYFPDPEV